jgi:hypothetical protein
MLWVYLTAFSFKFIDWLLGRVPDQKEQGDEVMDVNTITSKVTVATDTGKGTKTRIKVTGSGSVYWSPVRQAYVAQVNRGNLNMKRVAETKAEAMKLLKEMIEQNLSK